MAAMEAQGLSGFRRVPHGPTWPRRVIKAFGTANLVLCGLGFYAIFGEWRILASGPRGHWRYFAQAYYAMTFIDLACLVVLLIAGIYLWGLRRRGLVVSNFLFGFQIVYFLIFAFLPLALAGSPRASEIGDSLAAAWGTGNVALTLEPGPVYPIVALVVLNLAYRRLKQAGSHGVAAATPSDRGPSSSATTLGQSKTD